MSGFKRATVRISQEVFRLLHEADVQNRFRRKKKPEAPENEQHWQAIQSAFAEMQDRQRYYEGLIADMDDEILRMEEVTSRELISYQEAFNQELGSQLESSAQQSNAILDALTERFHEALQRERSDFYQSLQRFDQQLARWNQDARTKQRLASQWAAQSLAIFDFLNQQFDTDRFAPGRMASIRRKLSLAEANLDQGLAEASLQASQQAFLELSDLRVELETRTMEWQNQFQVTLVETKEMYKTILANAQVPALDVAGNELPFLIDLDFWSNGAYQILLRDTKQLHQLLRERQRSLRLEDLERIRSQEIEALRSRLDSMIYEARLEAIQSQLRINIADMALQALEHQGYSLQAAGFSGDDMRGCFEAILRNEDQSSISIRITPKQGGDLSSDLEVISHDTAMRTAGELFARFQAIRSSLGQKGLTIRQVHSNSSPAPIGNRFGELVESTQSGPVPTSISDVRSHKI